MKHKDKKKNENQSDLFNKTVDKVKEEMEKISSDNKIVNNVTDNITSDPNTTIKDIKNSFEKFKSWDEQSYKQQIFHLEAQIDKLNTERNHLESECRIHSGTIKELVDSIQGEAELKMILDIQTKKLIYLENLKWYQRLFNWIDKFDKYQPDNI